MDATPFPTTRDEVDAYLKRLPDGELIQRAETAYADLQKIAAERPNSESHEQCFAALVLFSDEMLSRGLRRPAQEGVSA